MGRISTTFVISVEECPEEDTSKIEVIGYSDDYARKVLNTFEGDEAKRIINHLLTQKETVESRIVDYEVEQIRFNRYDEAGIVLQHLLDYAKRWGIVSISEFYSLCFKDPTSEDLKYGWTLKDLEGFANILLEDDSYIIWLPNPRVIADLVKVSYYDPNSGGSRKVTERLRKLSEDE